MAFASQQERGDNPNSRELRALHSGEKHAGLPAVERDRIEVNRDGGGGVGDRDSGDSGAAGELGAAVAADGLCGFNPSRVLSFYIM